MTKSLIIGASGQVARALRLELTRLGKSFVSTSSKPGGEHPVLDLGDERGIREFFSSRALDGVTEVYLPGALTHVDRCEQERDLCRRLNFAGPKLVAELCRERGLPLVFFSTEYVFGGAEYEGGQVGPFTEQDKPYPTSWYGQCKLDAESAVLDVLGDRALALRTTMIFCWDPAGMNFFMQLFRHLSKLQAGEPSPIFKIPVDQVSTPTYAPNLARNSVQLRLAGKSGIYNLVGTTLLSRKDLLERIVAEFGFDWSKCQGGFQLLKTAELGQAARRPLTAGLTMEKARADGLQLFSLADAFADIKQERKKG